MAFSMMSRPSATGACLLFLVASSCMGLATASSFLSRAHGADQEALNSELRSAILAEVEDMLGSKFGRDTESRVSRIEDMIRATFRAMPKNENDKLSHAAVRYSLHSYFVQRHAWYVHGLANGGEGFNTSSPTSIFQDQVEEFVQDAFERRLGAHGLDLHETAVLAATLENLVHHETLGRLNLTFRVLRMGQKEDMDTSQVDTVLDTYMMGYILGLNYTTMQPTQLKTVRDSIQTVYPTWGETQKFLRDVRGRSSFHKSFFNFGDVERLVEEVGDQYGLWQDKECRDLKRQLVEIEDKTTGVNGSGRVRIADFYGSALNDGNWQFSESVEYLTMLGAMDTSEPDNLRVIIPNYINSPSNCLASSKFYSVCCINECEDLLDRLEHRFAAPEAAPADIAAFVAELPSSSVRAGRTLPRTLLQRLEDIASTHGGGVPLHGRLFAQWMHHAYPRECPFPHAAGTTRPVSAEAFQMESHREHTASKEEMLKIVQAAKSASIAFKSNATECTEWSHGEELYVGRAALPLTARGGGSDEPAQVKDVFRKMMYLLAAVAGARALKDTVASSAWMSRTAASNSNGYGYGKDHYV